MSRPTLALCIPAYNAAWCLPRLLQSANDQTVPFDEILVYDDCSTDETSVVAKAYGARVIRGEENRGCSYGKNRLAEAALSDWIHFHDADDLLLPGFVETVKPRTHEPAVADVLLLDFEYRDAETDEVISRPSYDIDMLSEDPLAFVLSHKVVNLGVYRREVLLRNGGFDLDPAVLYNEDAAFHLRLALAGASFGFIPGVTSVNYRYAASMSASNQRECFDAQLAVFEKAARAAGRKHHPVIARRLWELSGAAASHGAWSTADGAATLASRLDGRLPASGSPLFRSLAAINPAIALRLREALIRRLRPHLRPAGQYAHKVT